MKAITVEDLASLRSSAIGAGVSSFLKVSIRHAAGDPSGLAYRFQGSDGAERDVTKSELARRVGRYAAALKGLRSPLSTQDATRVVLALPQGWGFVAAFFACIAAHVVAVPIRTPPGSSSCCRTSGIAPRCRAGSRSTTA